MPVYAYVLIGLAVLVVLFIAIVAMQPTNFRIERSTLIAAPAEPIFAKVNDFHKWVEWSPWEKIDPNLKRTYTGPTSGQGAAYAWEGNKQVGKGNMLIEESKAPQVIRLDLNFTAPFKASNKTTFAFKPTGGQTQVVWTMTGSRNFVFKAFGLFMNMDKIVGNDFEKGLASLKAVTESSATM